MSRLRPMFPWLGIETLVEQPEAQDSVLNELCVCVRCGVLSLRTSIVLPPVRRRSQPLRRFDLSGNEFHDRGLVGTL